MDAAAPSVLVLLGATATGKTAVAVEVARRLGGEIISADSRAFFRGLNVVTAKPSLSERAGVPHHLIDHIPFDASYDAMVFRRDVEGLVPEIIGRGAVPILAGGGTLYLRAVLGGLFEGPSKDEDFRAELEDVGSDLLHERLAAVDPDAARAIHPNDRLRIVRALEVHRETGRPISELQAQAEPLPYDFSIFGLRRERKAHRSAIARRAQEMIEAGLVGEIRTLLANGLTRDMQAYRTIGIPEVDAHLAGETTADEMADAIVRATWALARRQMSWFRREPNVVWLDVTERTVSDGASRICEHWHSRRRDGTA